MVTNNLTDIILEFHGRFSCFENSVVKKSGLTQAQSEILNIVSQSGTIKMKDIAEKRKISKCTLTVSIKRLEKKGFLKRVPLEKDKRVSLIQLTEKGARHLDMHHDAYRGWTRDVSSVLSTEEQELFYHLHKKMLRFE